MHKDSAGTYGKLCITAELRYGRGIHVGKEQVALVMKRLGIYGSRNAGSPQQGPTIHFDQGTQFGSWVFSQKVQEAGLAPSVGAVSAA